MTDAGTRALHRQAGTRGLRRDGVEVSLWKMCALQGMQETSGLKSKLRCQLGAAGTQSFRNEIAQKASHSMAYMAKGLHRYMKIIKGQENAVLKAACWPARWLTGACSPSS